MNLELRKSGSGRGRLSKKKGKQGFFKSSLLLFALLFSFGAVVHATSPEQNYWLYLSFDDAQSGTKPAVSQQLFQSVSINGGRTWIGMNAGHPVYASPAGMLRDPKTVYLSGTNFTRGYYTLYTSAWSGSTCRLAFSPDLIQRSDLATINTGSINSVSWVDWLFQDDTANDYTAIHALITISGTGDNGYTAVYEYHPTDSTLTVWSSGTRLAFFETYKNLSQPIINEGCIVKLSGTYHLFATQTADNTIHHFAAPGVTGTYSDLGTVFGVQGDENLCIGQIGGSHYRMWFSGHTFVGKLPSRPLAGEYFSDSYDAMKTWSAPMLCVDDNSGTIYSAGAMIPINDPQVEADVENALSYWPAIAYGSTAFDKWKFLQFGANAGNASLSSGTSANNGAGISNLTCYGLGLDPVTARPAGLPQLGTVILSGTGFLSLAFNRNPKATDTTLTIEATGDLGDPGGWQPLASSVNGAPVSGSGNISETGSGCVVAVQVQDTVPINSGTHRFMRLKITQ